MKHTHGFWWIGVTGVNPGEPLRARRAAYAFEVPLLLVSTYVLVRWYLGSDTDPSGLFNRIYDVALLLLFILESITVTSLVRDKARYLTENWLNLAIIALGLPLLLGFEVNLGALRVLRVLIVISVLIHLSGSLRKLLSYNQLGLTLLACTIVITLSGLVMSTIDPGIETAADGIWWAWVTVSTVGYGDIVPVTLPGRVLGSLVILLGMALVAVLTANIAAFMITQGREARSRESTERAEMRAINLLDARLTVIEAKLDALLDQKAGEAEGSEVASGGNRSQGDAGL